MYIITGASGHIGNNLVRLLNGNIKILLRKKDPITDAFLCEKAYGNLLDKAFLDAHINKGDVVIHLAGLIDMKNKDYQKSYEANVLMTQYIADICMKKGCRLVYASSSDVLTKKNGVFVVDENQKSFYAKTKAIATNYVLNLMKQGLNAIVLYPTAVLGIHDYKPSKAGEQINRVDKQKFLFYVRGGYNFIDVLDVCKALKKAADGNVIDEVIVSGYPYKIGALFKYIGKLTKKRKYLICIPRWLAKASTVIMRNFTPTMIDVVSRPIDFDNQKMKSLLVEELTPFDETILQTIAFFNER